MKEYVMLMKKAFHISSYTKSLISQFQKKKIKANIPKEK